MISQPVLYSEWTKIRSVRSLVWSLVAGVAMLVVLGPVVCGAHGDGEAASADFDPVKLGFWGLNFAQVAVAVFAMLSIGGEYETGTIRTSLAAVPQRGRFYVHKLLVAAGLSLAVAIPTALLTFFLSQRLLDEHGVSFGDPGTVRAVICLALYFPLLSLLFMGITAMFRSLVPAMGLLLPVLFLLSPLSMQVPGLREVVQFLPDRAGQYAAMTLRPDADVSYTAWLGLPIMAAWTAVAVFGGWRVLRSHDA
ncbi:ABC transporter permease [Frankia sp. AgB32]|uniref:ABC transporter permease n=1 Tax=Frankia sp. AgB32 TaxID=631119 RepID=UPI00200C672D|nr:ABC transporter permease [Frankia sp. AgB32]MCK9896360.1 ABC transporter permease [Frankia sp. AgB32]